MTTRFALHVWRSLAGFRDDTRGATAVLFALLAVPIFGLGMAAIDYGRAQTSKNLFQDAADSASAAGAQLLGQSHDVIEGSIRGYLHANLPEGQKDVSFAVTFAGVYTQLDCAAMSTV